MDEPLPTPPPAVEPTRTAAGSAMRNNLLALTALAVSCAALGVSVFEAAIERADQQASVWPYLQIGASYSSDGFALEAVNKGVGPALVRDLRVTLDGEPVIDWINLLDRVLGEGHGIDYGVLRATDVVSRVVSPGEAVTLFALPWNDQTRTLAAASGRIGLSACYCSVFDRCWTVVPEGADPQPDVCRQVNGVSFPP
ncbi:MAG: hypothetical protein ACFB2Z_01705 [Maricaulaceae bacterium]